MKRIHLVIAVFALFFDHVAFSQRLLKGIDIGGQPGIPAANIASNLIYVPNMGMNTLTVISGSSGAVVANVPLGQQPIAAAFNPVTNVVYVSTTGTGTGSGAIAEIDASSNTLIATIPVGYAVFIAVNPVTNLVYFSNSQWTVSVLDGSTNQIVGTITTGSQCCIEGIAVDDTTNRIYVTQQVLGHGNVNQLAVINGSTNKAVSFPVTGSSSVAAPVVDSTLNRVYIPDSTNSGLYVISGSTGKIIKTVLTGYYGPVAINSSTHQIANIGIPGVVAELGFFKASTFSQVGGLVNLPPTQSVSYLISGANNRYYLVLYNNTSIAVVAGPSPQAGAGTRRKK